MDDKKEKLMEVYSHISEALEQGGAIMCHLDASGQSDGIDYTERDLVNAMDIFTHVASNRAIKSGYLTFSNVKEKMDMYVTGMEAGFGFNSVEASQRVYQEKIKEQENKDNGDND